MFRALAEALPYPVWSTHADGTPDLGNARWDTFAGPGGVTGAWSDRLHPDDARVVVERWRASLASGDSFEAECRLCDATTGQFRWFVVRAAPLRDTAGAIVRWFGVAVDIDAVRRADARVAAERALLDAVLLQLPVGVVLGEAPGGRIVYGNTRVEEIFRHPVLPSPDVESYREWVAFHPDGRQVTGAEYPMARVLATGEATGGDEYLYQRGDGTTAWVRITGAPVRDAAADGALTGAVVVVQDIDRERRTREEREQLLTALGMERAKLDRLLAEAPTVMAIYSGPAHVITYVNPTWERTVGKPGVVGRPFREAFPELAGTGLFEQLDATYETGVPYANAETMVPLRRWDGDPEVTFWDLVLQPLPGDGAFGRDLLVHAVEITAQVRARREAELARAEAERANRAKSEFLAAMTHELRTPLNAIGGYAELLALGLHGPVSDAQRGVLERIQRSQEHLLGMITRVLTFARLEAGQIEYALTPVPLDDVVREMCALMEPLVHARGLTWTVAGSDALARADRDKLAQALLNLLSNAIKFTDAGGRITVEWGRVPDADGAAARVFVRVRDTGCGIPADRLTAVFEPFVQVDGGRTRQHEGAGLGLSISRDLARGMGGELTVESEVGAGSTFTITLPNA